MVYVLYYYCVLLSQKTDTTLLFYCVSGDGEIVWSGDKLVGTDGFFLNGCDNVSDNYYPAASL